MVLTDTKLANVMGGKTARACDNCIRKRARWYCAADDAFLCQFCDALVHSANPLACGHQRVRLKIASLKLSSLDIPTATWHKGFTKKSRTPRSRNKHASHQTPKSKEPRLSLSPLHVVPSESDDLKTKNSDDQLPYQVPVFDPFSGDPCFSKEFENLSTPDESEAPFDLNNFNGLTLPSELELAEFAADVESLLGKSLDEEPFDIESLGMVDCRLESSLDDVVKVEEEVHCEAVDMMREPFELNFDYDSALPWEEEDEMCVVKNESEKCEVVCDDQVIFHTQKSSIKIKKMLKLDYEGIIGAWDDDRSPWISGDRPELDPNDCWLDCMRGCGKMEHYHCGDMGMMMWNSSRLDGGREARVSRYKEKRRTRLFSKKISKLETLYMTKSLANKLYLKKKLYTFCMPTGRKISEHIDEFNKIVFDLANIEVKFKDEDLALLLLTSLPALYEHFVDTLLYGQGALTLEDVMATLNSKEIKERSKAKEDDDEGLYVRERTNHRDSRQSRGNLRSKSRGGRLKCYIFQSEDHLKRNCSKNNRKKSTGSARLDHGFRSVRSESGKVKVINGSRVILSGIRRDNCVYSLDGHAMAGELNASVEEKDSLAQVWHKRLGHISEARLQVLEKQGLFGKNILGKLNFSENCVLGKSHRVSFGVGRHTIQGVIDYVHLDLWSPSQVESLGGKRSPSRAIEKKAPMEMWSGHPSDYGMLRIFGCVAYTYDKQGKLEPRWVKCVPLGYPEGVKGYRLYRLDDESPKIVTSRNMVFNESVIDEVSFYTLF
ncbi:zinc finger protein CONSTANS-LIKE 16-like protein [Tanacetum coccineum]